MAAALASSLAWLPAAHAVDDELLFVDLPSVHEESKYRQQVSEAPSWVSVVTAEEIRAFGHRTLLEVLDSVPGLYASDDRSYGSIGARGFGDPGDFSTRVLLLLDGVRINDGGLLDTASLGRHFLLDLAMVERIEISRGPGSSLYGNNAITAVINVISSDGRDIGGSTVEAGVGSLNARELSLAHGARSSGQVEYLVSANRYEADGNAALEYPDYDDPPFSDGVARHIDAEADSNASFKLRRGNLSLHGAFSERRKQIPTASFDVIFGDPGNITSDRAFYLNLGYDHTFGTDVEWHGDLNAQRQDYESQGDYYLTDPLGPDPQTTTAFDSSDTRWVSAQQQLTVHRFTRHTLIFGTDMRYSSKLRRDNYDEQVTYYRDDRTSWSVGAFVQDQFLIGERLQLFTGLRYDAVKDSIRQTTPRLGLVWAAHQATTLKLLYSSAFRAPNIYDLWQPGEEPGSFEMADLGRERIVARELVIEQQLGQNWRAVANLFDFRISDLIGHDDGGDALVNRSGSLTTHGIDVAVDGRLGGATRLQASLTLQRSAGREGSRLANSPERVVKAGVIYPLIEDRLILGTELRHTGDRLTLDGEKLDAFTTVNLTLNAPAIVPGLGLRLGVYNAFDERYSSVVGSTLFQNAIEQDGRTWRLTLGYRFR